MQLTWIPARRRFVGTQTEARAEKAAFEVRDVPVVKAELIEYLNAREEEHEAELQALRDEVEALRSGAGNAPQAELAAPSPSTPPAARTHASTTDLVEEILEVGPDKLPQILSAAIGRLGEIAGVHGWASFAKNVYSWSPAAKSVEQGLGMLMLAAFNNFGVDPAAPKAKPTPIQPVAED